MRLLRLAMVAALGCLAASASAAPAPPGPGPASAVIWLGGHAVSIASPAGWQATDITTGGRSITYTSADGAGSMTITVEPQPNGAPTVADLRAKIGPKMVEAIAARLKAAKAQITAGPALEDDPRFALRVHDAFKASGQSVDQVHLYQVVGNCLVFATSSAFGATPDKAAAIHKTAEQAILSARADNPAPIANRPATTAAPATAPSDKPITIIKAKVRLFPPAGWTADTTDRTDGTIATLRQPGQSSLIRVDCYSVPDDLKADPAGRQKYIESLVSGTQQTFKLQGAEMAGKPQKVVDSRFLKKVRITYEGQGGKFEVSSRHIAVGDAVLTVTTLGTADVAESLLEIADGFALAVRPAGK